MPSPLLENLRHVRERIDSVAGPRTDGVALLAVTKSVSTAVTRELALAGQRDLAENRAEVLEAKALALADLDVRWHFVGHIQRNKARRVVAHAHVIHSVDSLRLLHALQRLAAELGRSPTVYLQVNATGEAQKQGFAPADLPAAAAEMRSCPNLQWLGLMAMGPTDGDPVQTKRAFDSAANLARSLEKNDLAHLLTGGRCQLSMGMSADLELAIAAGSSVVRVGRALFHGLPAEADQDPPPALGGSRA